MILLETDKIAAAIVFSTLNTTRARLDLIQRLAKAKISDRDLLRALDKLVDRFSQATRDRNEFNHCIYAVNEQGEITHTQTMRVREVRGRIQFGEIRKLDQERIKEMLGSIRDLKQLNREIWDILPRLEVYFARKKARAGDRGVPPQAAE
jgi:ribosome-interacting GTPase 1